MKIKAGFALAEFLMVATTIAIVVAVVAPLITGTKNRTMVAEARVGLSTIRRAMEAYQAENGHYPTGDSGKNLTEITDLCVTNRDFDGKFFKTDGYTLTAVTSSNYLLTTVGYTNGAETLNITLNDQGNWGRQSRKNSETSAMIP
ncbi:MAG: hypothetical protein WCS52_05945 [bacterium]